MVLYDYHEVSVTRLGVCIQNKVHTNLTDLRAFYMYYDSLLLTTAYSALYAVHFFLGQFPNIRKLCYLLLSPLFLIELLYFPSRSI